MPHLWCTAKMLTSTASTAFLHHRGEAPAPETKRRLNVSSNANAYPFGGHAITVADDPHGPGSVIDLIHASAECSPRRDYSSSDSNFAIAETRRISIDVGDRSMCRTCGSRQHDGDHGHGNHNPEDNFLSIHWKLSQITLMHIDVAVGVRTRCYQTCFAGFGPLGAA